MGFDHTARAGAGFRRGALWHTTGLVAVSIALATPGGAATLFWDAGDTNNGMLDPADGIWDTTSDLWATDVTGSGPVAFSTRDVNGINEDPGDIAVFSDANGSTVAVTVATAITPERIEIQANGYSFDGGGTFGNTLGVIGASTITFDLSAGVLATIFDVNLEGNFVVEGDGTLVYSGTATDVESFTIQEPATFTLGGDLTANGFVDNFGTITVDGTVTAPALRNRDLTGATMTVTGTVTGDLVNRRDAFVEGTVSGEVENRGADAVLRVTGDLDADTVVNSEGADLTVQDGSTLDVTSDADLSNIDSSTLTLNGTVADGVTSAGTLDMNDGATTSGVIQGDLTNTGTATLAGTIQGDLNNQPGGDVTVDGDIEVEGIVRNDAVLTVNNGDTLLASGGDLRNRDGGDLNVNGTVDGTVDNLGGAILDVGNNGIITGDTLNDQGGSMTLAGTIQGVLNNDSAVDDGTGTGTGVTVDGDATVEGLVDNDGDITVASDRLTLEGGIAQDGRLTVALGATLDLSTALSAPNRVLTSNEALTNDGTIIADEVINAATGTLTQTGHLTGDLTNEGVADLEGQVTGALVNDGNLADLDITGDLTAAGITNSGGARLDVEAGTTTATALTNEADSVSVIADGATLNVSSTVANDADGTFEVSGTLGADLDNDGSLTIASTGALDGDLDNSGDADIAGQIDGELTNTGGGTVTVVADGSVGLGVTNAGGLTLDGGNLAVTEDITNTGTIRLDQGNLTVTQTVTNDGIITIDNGETLQAGGLVTNRSGAEINANGVLDGSVQNDLGAVLDVGEFATIDGSLVNDGDTRLGGSVTGTVTNNSAAGDGGLTVDHDTVVTGLVRNDGAMTVTANDTLTANDDVDNNADLTVNGTIIGDVANSGSVGIADSGEIDGTLTVTGTGSATIEGILRGDLDNNEETEVLNGGRITGDADNSDRLTVASGGTLSGNLTNSGNATIGGTVGGTVVNQSGATVTAEGGTFTGDVTNSAGGDFEVTANTNVGGDFTNEGTLTGNTDGGLNLSVGGTFENAGTIVNNGISGTIGVFTITADLIINSQVLDGSFALIGDLVNMDTINFTDDTTLDGALTNEGVITTSATVDMDDNPLTNEVGGDLDINAGGAFVTTGIVTNAGDFDINTGGALTGGAIINEDGGAMTSGGTINGPLTNEDGGTLITTGLVNGDVTNDAGGMATVSGTVNGDLNSAGTLGVEGTVTGSLITTDGVATLTGELSAGDVSNDAELVVGAGTQLSATGTIVNETDGTLRAAGVLDGDVLNRNGGALTTTGGVTGNLVNRGDATVGSPVDGSIINRETGEFAALGDVTAQDFLNEGGAIIGLFDTVELDGSFTNAAAGNLSVDGILTADFDGEEGSSATVFGRISGDVVSAGSLTVDGRFGPDLPDGDTIEGDLTTTGQVRVTNDSSISGAVNINDGTVRIQTDNDLAVAEGVSVGGDALLRVDGTLTSDLNNNGVAIFANDFAGDLNNTGLVTIGGDATGAVVNMVDGARLEVDGTVTNGLTNTDGASALVGAITGDLNNTLGSEAEVLGAVDGNVISEGEATIGAGVTGNIDSEGTLDVTGDVGGEVISVGTLTMAGDIAGRLRNNGTGTVTGNVGGNVVNTSGSNLTMAGNAGADVSNEGALSLDGTVTGDVTSSGTALAVTGNVGGSVTVTAGVAEIDGSIAAGLTNDGTTTVTGAVTGDVSNSGDLTLGDVLTGNLTNTDGGVIIFGGNVSGDVTSSGGGSLTLADGVQIGGTLSTDSDFEVAAGEGFTVGAYENMGGNALIEGTLNTNSVNSGTMTFGDAGVANGDLRNTTSGVLQMVDGAQITGDLINNGSFLLSVPTATAGDAFELPNVAGETVTVSGGLGGSGSFTLDVDLSDSTGDSSAQGDTVVFLGAASGDFIINLNVIDPASLGEQENDIVLIDVNDALGPANDFTISEVNGLPVAEQFVYVLTRTNGGINGTGDLLLADSVNPAFGALAGNVALTQSLIGSVVNRPTSPFVVGLGVDDGRPCGVGGWARASAGQATAGGATVTEAGVSSESEIDATYYGVQFGGDFACFQGHFSGWDLAFGGIGGVNQGSTDQPVFAIDPNTGFATGAQLSTTTADFQQIYGGVYMTATRGPLALDLQLRQEQTSFTLNNSSVAGGAGLGLKDTEFDSSTTTLSGAISYAFALENGWAVTPTAGFAYSTSSTDTIVFDDGATLDIQDSERQIGFLGGTVSKSKVGKDGRSLLSYFATGTYYQDFADPVVTTYTPFGGVGEQSESDNLGAYGEISFGVSYIKILTPKQGGRAARQFSASARADARFSSTLSGGSITAQARWQF